MIDFILNIIAYFLISALVLIPLLYLCILINWTINNKWCSTIFKHKYLIVLYFFLPPLAWYDASVQMKKEKRKFIPIMMTTFILFFFFIVGDYLSVYLIEHPLSGCIINYLTLFLFFLLPICIIFSVIIKKTKEK